MNNSDDNDKKSRARIIIMIIVIIIIILALITSCGCSSKLWGRIGKLFTNESKYTIDNESDGLKVIVNKDLTFDKNNLSMSLSDTNLKLSYSYKNINPDKFTCKTSDANIATCYIEDGYVVVNPKDLGKVDIFVDTVTNGQKYEAKTSITITDINRFINLDTISGTINLATNKTKVVPYTLTNLDGKINITISDTAVAKARISNGNLIITGLKTGSTKITLTITYENKNYEVTYNLKVINNINVSKKDNNSSLKELNTSNDLIDFKANVYNYYVSVPNSTDKLTFKTAPKSSKSQVTYKFNGKIVDDLNNLPLQEGENKLEITVTAEDGSTSTYEVTINRSKKLSSDNTLKDLTVSEGLLTPSFNPNILDYHVNVSSSTTNLDVLPKLKDNKSQVTYKFNGKETSNLEDLELKKGSNKVEITIESEDGKTRTYTVTIERELDNYLSDIEIPDLELNEEFNENNYHYSLDVPFDYGSFSLKGILSNKNNMLSAKLNGKATTLEDLELQNGENKLEITVQDSDGNTNTYTIDIYQEYRLITIDKGNYDIYLEDLINETFTVPYEIIEYTRDNPKGLEITDYNVDDITVSSSLNNYQNYQNYLEFKLNKDNLGKHEVTLTYENANYKTNLDVKIHDYYVNVNDSYNIDITDGVGRKNIVLDNNLFTGDVTVKNTKDGLIICDKNNPNICLTITGSADLNLQYVPTSGNTSLVIEVTTSKEGEFNLEVNASVYDVNVKNANITIKTTSKYIITLNAINKKYNGFYNEITTVQTFKLGKEEQLNLADYPAYVLADTTNCIYYGIIGYSKTDTNSTVDYEMTTVLTVTSDLTLYAVYEETAVQPPINSKTLYLSEVDLFHNEEYYQAYHEDKVIYPGAMGSYTMHLENKTGHDITITSLSLTEETICLDSKCLNMGYIIKDINKNYLGRSGVETDNSIYDLLNHSNENIIPINVSLKNNEITDIAIIWRWLDYDDDIDTKIGNYVAKKYTDATINDIYALTVGINFETKDNCTLGSDTP